jgi:hypothetical protein
MPISLRAFLRCHFRKRDMGEAKVIVELKDGYIHVTLGKKEDKGFDWKMIRFEAYEGDWKKIMLAIYGEGRSNAETN